jgi:hybrid cluster-associated redox disulfide protein
VRRFTENTLISDVLDAYPGTTAIFESHGLGCASCLAAGMETISAVALMHDVSSDVLLDELNEFAERCARKEPLA